MAGKDKLGKLTRVLRDLGSVLIGFSGGVDSAFLCTAAQKALGNKACAVTVVSGFLPRCERKDAERLAKKIGLRHETLYVRMPRTCLENPVDRCYHCKKFLFSQLKRIAKEKKIRWVIDGSNIDDAKEFRPGKAALKALGIRSPLQEAGMGKRDIRTLARRMGIDIWDKPAYTCLATRIPFGQRITAGKLSMVQRAEEVLRQAGFALSRVRHHNEIARIEVPGDDIFRLVRKASSLSGKLKKLGFRYVTIDLQGYRGSVVT